MRKAPIVYASPILSLDGVVASGPFPEPFIAISALLSPKRLVGRLRLGAIFAAVALAVFLPGPFEGF